MNLYAYADIVTDNGTLASGWGSGSSNFPYLVTPLTAIQNEVLSNSADIQSVLDNYAYTQIETLAQQVNDVSGVAIVFVNADSGEGYITVDNNEGDRNNLTLWHDGDTLIQNVTAICNNVIVVMHTVGPVLVDAWYQNPNVTAIIWAGIPGQESGNAIADVLYGRVNPSGKLPFTMGSSRGQYGTDILYEPNNGGAPPQDNFLEGVFIDYRAFDRLNETPIYEFGFGLSYTTFSYSNLQVEANSAAPAYVPTSGSTTSAPTFGTISNDTSDYLFPAGFHQVPLYIYPYLNFTTLAAASEDPQYAINYTFPADSSSSSPQPLLPASGASGGNPRLYDILFTVSATVTNTGSVAGEEVPQLYISLGGPNDPKVALRQFDKFPIAAGASRTFTAELTRRDLSNWDTLAQDWFISTYPKTVYVGSSSRKLPLSAVLSIAGTSGASSSGNGTYTAPSQPSTSGSSSSSGVVASLSASSYGSASTSTSVSATATPSSSVVASLSPSSSASKTSASASSSAIASPVSATTAPASSSSPAVSPSMHWTSVLQSHSGPTYSAFSWSGSSWSA